MSSSTATKSVQQHLYVQTLLSTVSQAAQDLSNFADTKTINSKRSILFPTPGSLLEVWATFAKLLDSVIKARHSVEAPASLEEAVTETDLGDYLHPEHLPPVSRIEVVGDMLRSVLRYFTSDSSKFGCRVVFATMSIGILGFLRQTQHFFIEFRLVWAMVMIPISMSPTSGNAIYGFFGRAFGTAFAMTMAYINWYIVDGKPAGVIVFFFISMMVYYQFLLRYPRYIVVFILAAVNHVLIVGYELQAGINGVKKATVSGQMYFPLYTLAPYRLLCVLAGLFVALVWTIFPVQISEHSILRTKVSNSISLLSKYCGSVSATLDMRLHDLEGDLESSSSPGRQVKAIRYRVLYQELALLAQMRQHSELSKFEVSIGGKFPKMAYDTMINEIQR